jgi:prepilin-type N-terminal cleavage/methylation domain-containing protein
VVPERLRPLTAAGFTAAELLVVVAILGVVAVVSIPTLINYFQASTLKAGAEELAAALNRGRQLAITQNRNVCVEVSANQYRYRVGTDIACNGGTVWEGPGAGPNGFFRLANNVNLTANSNPVFTYLGAATGATLTVTYVTQSGDTGRSRNVVVAASGRIQIQ